MEFNVNKETLFRHFAGNNTVLEKKQIDEWAKESANEEFFFQVLLSWEKQNKQFMPNVDEAISNHFDVMASQVFPYVVNKPNKKFLAHLDRFKLSIAVAAVFFMTLLGWLSTDTIMYEELKTGYGEVKAFELKDGSKVTLNANSSLQIPRFGFNNPKREVVLSGEAEFSVTHAENNEPFFVKTKRNFDVVVLGTEFSVFSRSSGSNVILKTGKVQFRYKKDKQQKSLYMKPGDLVILRRDNFEKVENHLGTRKFSPWKTHTFVFDQTPLTDIAKVLSENFGSKCTIVSPELGQRTITGEIEAKSANELTDALTEILQIEITIKGDELIFQ